MFHSVLNTVYAFGYFFENGLMSEIYGQTPRKDLKISAVKDWKKHFPNEPFFAFILVNCKKYFIHSV